MTTLSLLVRTAICTGLFVVASVLRSATPPLHLSLELVPTFESVGASLAVDGPLEGLRAEFTFRKAGEAAWRAALAPVAYAPDRQFRGSLLLLEPGMRYEVKARVLKDGVLVGETLATTTTWTDTVPIAREIVLPAGVSREALVIREHGEPTGWIRYRAAKEGSTIDVGGAERSAVVLDHAAYVIVEGLTIRGGVEHAVHVVESHDVRVRSCDIAGWGDAGNWRYSEKKKQWAYLSANGDVIDRQAGIRVRGAMSWGVVLENNLIHHPRGTAGSWAFEHPHGPSGIVLSETGGNNVVRFNDLIPGDGHRWNDAIESEFNSNVNGGPYRDTDIYGNLLVDPNDDGTELDGGQINVRYWYNRIEGGLCGVSCAPNLRGPSYVFRNVIVLGDERGAVGAGFKMGGDRFPNPGVSFLLNNTIYARNYGLTAGHYGKGPTPIFSRNNIFSGPVAGHGRVRFDRAVAGDLDHDLIPPDGMLGTTEPSPQREAHALFSTPRFVAAERRDFHLQTNSPGWRAGEALPNLSAGATPDQGAVDSTQPFDFWPVRPGAPEFSTGREVIRVVAGQTLRCPIHVVADEAWRVVAGEAWLTCEPAAGSATEFTCRVDATTLKPGIHRTFVSVRGAQGSLRSLPLEVEVEPADIVRRRFQPETAPATPGFSVERDPGTNGVAWVRTVAAEKPGVLAFDFDVPTAGEYFVLARVRATGPVARITDQDSLALSFDEGKPMTWDLFGLGMETWTWVVAHPQAAVDGRFKLSAGHHRLQLAPREHDLQLDEIVISNSPFSP